MHHLLEEIELAERVGLDVFGIGSRKLDDVELSRTVTSDACRVFGKHLLRTVFGREGLIEPTTHAQYKTTGSLD